MQVTLNELNHRDACIAKRRFEYVLKPHVTDHMEKAGAIKSVVKDVIKGNIKKEDATKTLKERMDGIEYPNEEQKRIHVADAARQVSRYLGCEKRSLTVAAPMTVSLSKNTNVLTNPDFIYVTSDQIEVIKLKCSKPTLSQRDAYKDLGLYAMHLYGRALIPPEETRKVTASYYFLRKANDSNSKEEPRFDEEFFNNTGGRNIISIVGEYNSLDDKTQTDVDMLFQNHVELYESGLSKEECSESDCEKCNLKMVCKYVDPPIVIKKVPKNHSLSDLTLTKDQERVIEYESGICRVNAGAGAGKTMVVALRTATLLNKGVKPEEILLITFTNAGAEEMRTRIGLILKDFGLSVDVNKMHICTFNAFGDEIIKREYAQFGFTEAPKVIDDIERSRIIADLLNKVPVPGLDYRNFETNMKTCVGALAIAKQVFSIVKRGQYSASDSQEVHKQLENKANFTSRDAVEGLIRLYDDYDNRLKADNLIEYDDQMVLVEELLKHDPYYMERFKFSHIIVDEFQDTDKKQIDLLKVICDTRFFRSLMVVGDDSQAIFGFRDTTPEYILHFDEVMNAEIDDITLAENHRSTPEIIGFANKINDMRKDKLEKDLVSTRPHGKDVVVKGFLSKQEEAEFVLGGIKEHIADGHAPEDIAIIASTKYELMEMADLLTREGIPSVMLNPEPLIENGRVQAAISLFSFLCDEEDEEDMLIYANAKSGGALIDASANEIKEALVSAQKDREGYYAVPDKASRKNYVINLLTALCKEEDEVYQSFVETLKFKSIEKMFEYAKDFYRFGTSAAFRRVHDYPGVVLTTAHSSKGLEWNIVYNMISKYDAPELYVKSSTARARKEEKMRLLFVSATRARDELYVTGQFVAFGKRGEYTYNQFLIASYEGVGKPIGPQEISLQIEEREVEKKLAKKLEKELAKNAS